jgi:hypothetical protein
MGKQWEHYNGHGEKKLGPRDFMGKQGPYGLQPTPTCQDPGIWNSGHGICGGFTMFGQMKYVYHQCHPRIFSGVRMSESRTQLR